MDAVNYKKTKDIGGMIISGAVGGCKQSIILFDTKAGTRNFTVPTGVYRIRVFVVGAGGEENGGGGGYAEKEYSVNPGDEIEYTVGAAPGGTSSWDADISATGGGDYVDSPESAGAGGEGSGGDTNHDGGDGYLGSPGAGGSSGNRWGDGFDGDSNGGAGWGEDGQTSDGGTANGIDGFGIGMIPGGRSTYSSYSFGITTGYGSGGARNQSASIGGGGGAYGGCGGIGGGGGTGGLGGPGLVGVEVLI